MMHFSAVPLRHFAFSSTNQESKLGWCHPMQPFRGSSSHHQGKYCLGNWFPLTVLSCLRNSSERVGVFAQLPRQCGEDTSLSSDAVLRGCRRCGSIAWLPRQLGAHLPSPSLWIHPCLQSCKISTTPLPRQQTYRSKSAKIKHLPREDSKDRTLN